MSDPGSRKVERGGTAKVMLWSSIAAAVLFIAALVWGALPTYRLGDSKDRSVASSERTHQEAGSSTTGQSSEAVSGFDRENVGGRARNIEGSSSGSVSLAPDQRQSLMEFAKQHRSAAVDAGNVSIVVGAAVPRQVPLQPLPAELTQRLGAYVGDHYFIVEGKLVIVEPQSQRIVAIVPTA
jgi:hypothetical protein